MMTDMLEKVKNVLGDKYDIFAMISEGGMGKIYLGTHRALNRQVAVKIIHQQFSQDKTVRERFCREAKLAANLDYPGIVDIYDFGSEDEFDYIIMRYIKGETLAQKLEREGSLPCEQALEIVMAVARALSHAHKNKVVHRDIKPSNIMIDENAQVILTDFGISKDLGDTQLTAADTVIGSPKYMSPEQIRGAQVDGRSDLYALGLIFYEMVTGKHPFQGRDTTSLFYAQAHEMPPEPVALSKPLPASAGAVIMKMLSKKPEDRFQTGDELWRNLQSCCNDTQSPQDLNSDATIVEMSLADDATRVGGWQDAVGGASSPAVSSGNAFQAKLIQSFRDKKLLWGGGGLFLVIIVLVLILRSGDTPTKNPAMPGSQTIQEAAEQEQTPASVADPTVPASASLAEGTAPQTGTVSTGLPPAAEKPLSTYDRIVLQIEELGRLEQAAFLRLWSNQSVFRVGDIITYSFESKKPCYLVILNLTSDGELVQIFPNKFHASAFIQTGKTYNIPGEDADISLSVTGPPGTDRLIALTSEMPFDIFQDDFGRQAFSMLDRSDARAQETVLGNLTALHHSGVAQLKYNYVILE